MIQLDIIDRIQKDIFYDIIHSVYPAIIELFAMSSIIEDSDLYLKFVNNFVFS